VALLIGSTGGLVKSYDVLDEALESISSAAPDLQNGLTNHAPMVVEAMCRMGRGDAVFSWLERYREGMDEWPPVGRRISTVEWRDALGRPGRLTDWREFFKNELQEGPWRDVLDRWTARLGPGMSASATHGVIRVGHAVRSLEAAETSARHAELASSLAYWAATYQALPSDLSENTSAIPVSEAIKRIELVPNSDRTYDGTIMSSLVALDQFPPFAPVIGLADLSGDLETTVSDLVEGFARVYLANAHDSLTSIVLIHGVTSVAGLRNIVRHVSEKTAREAMRFAWQTGCSLYATFGSSRPAAETARIGESGETLIDTAISIGDEHGIKFTEACLSEDAVRPSPVYAAAARHALGMLTG
jgi:hypothetical protein